MSKEAIITIREYRNERTGRHSDGGLRLAAYQPHESNALFNVASSVVKLLEWWNLAEFRVDFRQRAKCYCSSFLIRTSPELLVLQSAAGYRSDGD